MSLTELSKENLQVREKNEKPVHARPALQSLSNSSIISVQVGAKNPNEEYSEEILAELLKEESIWKIPSNYLSSQLDITSKMRGILVDWLVSVHRRFKLMPETLFLSVKITDKYLLLQETTRKDLQLVGITSLFLASKYEEIHPPELRDLILLTDRACTKEQALNMERQILKTLDFQITIPTAWRFFEKFSEKLADEDRSMGQYLLELSLIDDKMLIFTESMLAASAVYVSQKLFKKDWKYSLSIYSESEIKPCATELLVLFQIALTHPLTAVRDKFSKPQYHQVSTICLE